MKILGRFLAFALGIIWLVNTSPIERKRLIKISESDPGVWMTESEIVHLRTKGRMFVDITNDRDFSLEKLILPKTISIPTNLTHPVIVNRLIIKANQSRVEDFVRNFTSFFNRYYDSESGAESAKWLLSQVESSLAGFNGNGSVRKVDHEWRQSSVVARIEGVDPQLQNEVVVLGGHEDSISEGGANSSAPGADDNASGSVIVLETLRILVEAGFRPKRTIDFHWYAAEEVGLLGSEEIAREYRERDVNVVAMLNLDVVGYQPPNVTEISIFADNANEALVQFLKILAEEYLSFSWKENSCGYACSDHASWTRYGYPAALSGGPDPQGNPNVHSPHDTFETVGFQQVMEIVKLAIGFAVEMALEA